MRFKNETVSIVRWNKSERKEKIVRKKKIDWNWQRMKFITQVRNIYLFFPIIFIKIYFSILLYISRVFYSNMLFLLFLLPCSWSTRKKGRVYVKQIFLLVFMILGSVATHWTLSMNFSTTTTYIMLRKLLTWISRRRKKTFEFTGYWLSWRNQDSRIQCKCW